MKKSLTIVVAAMLLVSFTALARAEAPAVRMVAPPAAPAGNATSTSNPEPLSAQYAQILRKGTYYYSLTVETATAVQTVTGAAKDGMYYISTGVKGDSITMLIRDGKGYAAHQSTGEVQTFDPAGQGQHVPDYSTLTFKSAANADGKVTETYTCKTADGGAGTVVFVLKNGKLIEMTTPELSVEGTWPVTDFRADPADALFEVPALPEGPVSPYAWLGYAELPQNNYFDIIATGCFYRTYDVYTLGLVSHQVQASDIKNQYQFDGGNNITLNLNGMTYVLNQKNKTYFKRDATSIWATTLETQANNREKGINSTGKKFVTKGVGPVPLLCENGDAADYTYYEFLADSSTTDNPCTLRDRIYFKDGDVYAIHTLVTMGTTETEMTEVITEVSCSPDAALFALPADFDQYKPIV